jgi:rare lipoprotein A
LLQAIYSKQFHQTRYMHKHLIQNVLYTLLISAFPLVLCSFNDRVSAQTETQIKSGKQTESVSSSTPSSTSSLRSTVLKVGETRSQSITRSQEGAIAKIFSHKIDQHDAATVYVRGIPVLTFIGSSPIVGDNVARENVVKPSVSSTTSSEVIKLNSPKTTKLSAQIKLELDSSAAKDPLERATAAAALINQLSQDGLEANSISPAWESGNYVIKFGDRAILTFDDHLTLPQTTRNKQEDVLQATNLLRRLVGGAPAVNKVTNAPVITPVALKSPDNDLIGHVTDVASGLASWYGPGFEGAYSANGERFDASAMTAAHLTLPFGTKVRVTNLDNGKSVVVRINDRGPFTGDRILDMSQGSADVIGLTHSGVAPVKMEVLSPAALIANPIR